MRIRSKFTPECSRARLPAFLGTMPRPRDRFRRPTTLTPRPRHPSSDPNPAHAGAVPPTPEPPPTPHPAAPAGASDGSARPSWGPAPSGWTSSHPRGSFGRTSCRGKPGPHLGYKEAPAPRESPNWVQTGA